MAIERGEREVASILNEARARRQRILIPAGALAQAWRGGARQARLAMLLKARLVEVHPLDLRAALAAGTLCAQTRTRDVIDASVVMTAWNNGRLVVTSDPTDLLRLDPGLTVIEV